MPTHNELDGSWNADDDPNRTSERYVHDKDNPDAVWPYFDENGEFLFGVMRGDNEVGQKAYAEFRWVSGGQGFGAMQEDLRDGTSIRTGLVFGGTSDVRRVPYCFKQALETPTEEALHFMEGEKNVDGMRAAGFNAVCFAGAARQEQYEFGMIASGRQVCIWPDNDGKGRNRALRVYEELMKLKGAAAPAAVVVVDIGVLWPGCPANGDISDYLDHIAQRAGKMSVWRGMTAHDFPYDWKDIIASAAEAPSEDHANLFNHPRRPWLTGEEAEVATLVRDEIIALISKAEDGEQWSRKTQNELAWKRAKAPGGLLDGAHLVLGAKGEENRGVTVHFHKDPTAVFSETVFAAQGRKTMQGVASDGKTFSVTKAWMDSGHAEQYDFQAFEPSKPPFWTGEQDGKSYKNSYVPAHKEPAKYGDAAPYIFLATQNYGDDAKVILQWLSHTAKRLDQPLGWAIVAQGAKGCGKNTLTEEVVRYIHGRYATKTTPKKLEGRFNGLMKNKLAVVLDEVGAITGKALGDLELELRDYITGTHVEFEVKYGGQTEDKNVCNWAILTNYKFAMFMEDGASERRYAPLISKLQSREDIERALPAGWWEDESNGFSHVVDSLKAMRKMSYGGAKLTWFQCYFHWRDAMGGNEAIRYLVENHKDVGESGPAPVTSSVSEAMTSSKAWWKIEIDENIAAAEWGYTGSYINGKKMQEDLDAAKLDYRAPGPNQLGTYVKQLGYGIKVRCKRDGERITVYSKHSGDGEKLPSEVLTEMVCAHGPEIM